MRELYNLLQQDKSLLNRIVMKSFLGPEYELNYYAEENPLFTKAIEFIIEKTHGLGLDWVSVS